MFTVIYEGDVITTTGTYDEAWLYILRHQGQAVDYALENGWGILETVGGFLVKCKYCGSDRYTKDCENSRVWCTSCRLFTNKGTQEKRTEMHKVNLSKENTDAAIELLRGFSDSARDGLLVDLSFPGILLEILRTLDFERIDS